MLNGTLALHDITDTEAFCHRLIAGSKLTLTHHDREDLAAYLVETAWELSTTNPQPWRTSFSGWVHPILRLRIVDWQRNRHGRTTWKFHGHTYQRPRPQPYSLDDPELGITLTQTHRDPAPDRNASDLVRILRTRNSDEAWRHHQRRPQMPRRTP